MKRLINVLALLALVFIATAVTIVPVHAGSSTCPYTKSDYDEMRKAVFGTDKYKQCSEYCTAVHSKDIEKCEGSKNEMFCRDCAGGFFKKCDQLCREAHPGVK